MMMMMMNNTSPVTKNILKQQKGTIAWISIPSNGRLRPVHGHKTLQFAIENLGISQYIIHPIGHVQTGHLISELAVLSCAAGGPRHGSADGREPILGPGPETGTGDRAPGPGNRQSSEQGRCLDMSPAKYASRSADWDSLSVIRLLRVLTTSASCVQGLRVHKPTLSQQPAHEGQAPRPISQSLLLNLCHFSLLLP